jgi:catechol 2,3-dioxygenase-like lactoylglutathione lyase family enzyme
MIRTMGLTHIALQVKDVKRASAFYQAVFGVKEMYVYEHFIQVQTPGTNDIIVFETGESEVPAIKPGFHFGFRLTSPSDIEKIKPIIEKAGGTIKDSGEFVPGEPYIFFYDPDGYEIEVWFEKIPETHNDFN